MRMVWGGILLLLVGLLAGCPPVKLAAPVVVPPPISLAEQVARLNSRSAALADLKGHGKVTVTYFDADGSGHTHDADGTLLLHQHPDDAANPVDMLLLGRVVGQDAFEAGMNRTQYWMAVRLDAKHAYVGTVANMANVAAGVMPLRADRLVELLGITPLHNSSQQRLGMLVNEQNGTNEIYLTQVRPDGRSAIERVLVVDRLTGQVTQVRLYNPDGTLLAQAELTKYRPVNAADGGLPAAAPPEFPRHIVIEYPDRHVQRTARVILDLGNMAAVAPLAAKRFAMPDFAEQGLTVVDLDQSEKGDGVPVDHR